MKSIFIMLLCMGLLVTQVSAYFITEIMYNPLGSDANREWVEVYGQPLTNVSFVEDAMVHSLHLVQGNCQQDCVSIIADDASLFLEDYNVSLQTLVYDSSWSSLRNTGEIIGLLYNNKAVDELQYEPVALDGESLQLVNSTFSSAKPTPGFYETTVTTTAVPEFNFVALFFVTSLLVVYLFRIR